MSCALDCRWSADVGLLCYRHHDRLAEMLDPRNEGSAFDINRPEDPRIIASIPVLYGWLDARRGSTGLAPIGPPAFGSRSPADDTVVVLRDARSREHVFGADDVEHAPRPPAFVLAAIAGRLGGVDRSGVEGLSSWLHGSLRALADQAWVPLAYRDLRRASGTLRAALGDPPPRSIGTCRVLVDAEGREMRDGPYRCAVPLYLPELPPRAVDEPMSAPSLRCSSCGHRYTGSELIEIANNPLTIAS